MVLTTGAGFACAGPASLDLVSMATACVGTGLCAASAGTFNQIIEKDRDSVMNRTKRRPLPSGHTSTLEAGALGMGTGIAGVSMLSILPNPDVASLGLMNIVLYAGVYILEAPLFCKYLDRECCWCRASCYGLDGCGGQYVGSPGDLSGESFTPLAISAFFSLSWLP